MSGVNKVILLGRLGKDPEIKVMANGNHICNFTVATNEMWKDKNTGQKKESTEWHNCVMFGKRGEIITKYFKKGDLIYLEGKIQTNKYEKKGQLHYNTKINVTSFSFVTNNNDNISITDDDIPF